MEDATILVVKKFKTARNATIMVEFVTIATQVITQTRKALNARNAKYHIVIAANNLQTLQSAKNAKPVTM